MDGFLVAFGLNDARFTAAARRTIDEAALEANRNGENSIGLIGTWDRREAEESMRRRMDMMADKISWARVFNGQITRIEPGPDSRRFGRRILNGWHCLTGSLIVTASGGGFRPRPGEAYAQVMTNARQFVRRTRQPRKLTPLPSRWTL